MKKLSFIIALSMLIGMFYSCEEQIEVQPEVNTESADTDFTVIDGYLSFSSTESFTNNINTISSFSKEERIKWEKQNGFLSQRTIVDMIIDKEIAIYDSIKEEFKGKKIDEINKRDLHSDIYNKYIDKGVIKLFDEGTKDEYWNHSACNPAYLDFINEEGFYAIGDTLYQITENEAKGSSNIIWTDWEGTTSHRAIMGIYLNGVEYLTSFGNHWNYQHNLYIYSQERTWWGGWMYSYEHKSFFADWDMTVFYNPKYLIGHSMGESFEAQYAKAIYPQTGYIYNYNYVFTTFSRQDNYNDYMYPPTYLRYLYIATVHVRTATESFNIELTLDK